MNEPILIKRIRFRVMQNPDGEFVVDYLLLWKDQIITCIYMTEEELWEKLPIKYRSLKED